jgi:aminopeptidase N
MTVFSEGRTLEQLAQNPLASILKGSAHESGHFWWNFGAGQGDWINESFAEYFALLAVKEINGDQAFASELVRCREAVKELPDDAPAISEVPFNNDGNGYTIRYQKGALMLDHLRQVLGDEAFYEASRGFYQKYKNQRIGTDEFRGFWKSALGEEKHWINTWLDSTGAMPVDTGLVN